MKLFNINKKKAARGFTLIEILLVVGFIALAGIGIYVVYNKVQTSNAANTEARNLNTLQAGVKNLYGGSVGYANISATILVNGHVVPDNMLTQGATTITNSFGGNVTVAQANYGGGTNNAFTITYPQVPLDVCAKFVNVGGNGFNQISVGGTPVKDTTQATGNAINIQQLTSSCAGGAGGVVTVTFTSI